MTRIKFLFAALVVAAIMAVVPIAHAATTVDFAGAGSSAQFLQAAVAADAQAFANLGGQCSFHFETKGNTSAGTPAALVNDDRQDADHDVTVPHEPGNAWVVWLADCSDATGNTNVTHVMVDISVDSTVGVREFMAHDAGGNGGLLFIDSTAPSVPQVPAALWPDGGADLIAIPSNVQSAIAAARVNVGLTDIRPEDALFATKRALSGACAHNSTYSQLGYTCVTAELVGKVGNNIQSQFATTSVATPVAFALSGADPIAGGTVRGFTTVPIGAAPIAFISNNGGAAPIVTDVADGKGVGGAAAALLSHLFDGTTSCDTHNKAFGGNGDGLGTPLTLWLREPLSGTMNTTEFSEFRTAANPNGSQETGVNPTGVNNNPLNMGCGTGFRNRGIGTGEIVKAIIATPKSLGYVFLSLTATQSLAGKTGFNYLTLDGVDPVFATTAAGQELPACSVGPPNTCTEAAVWGAGNSYPHLRDGTYRAWSLYRWVIDSGLSYDPTFGPSALAQAAQNVVNTTVADFVPFATTNASDPGLDVYRSHYKATGATIVPDNGVTNVDNNTLGGGDEAGNDVGGQIEGPFPMTVTGLLSTEPPSATVTWHAGVGSSKFAAMGTGAAPCNYVTPWKTLSLSIPSDPGSPFTVVSVNTAGTSMVLDHAPTNDADGVAYSITVTAPQDPGVLCKKQ